MKKLAILVVALITFQLNAQNKKENHKAERMHLEPQERAELHTKKMTLHLDLTKAQQNKVMALHLKNATKRSTFKKQHLAAKENDNRKLTKAQKLERKHAKLDAQIATKKEMKSILDSKQYETWSTMQVKREKGCHKRKGNKKRRKERL